MGLAQEQKQQTVKIVNYLKNFVSYKSGSEKLCKARYFGIDEYIDCLDENAKKCEFSEPYGEGYLCKCILRIYIAKYLKM